MKLVGVYLIIVAREFLRHPHQIWHVWYHFNSDKWFKSHVAGTLLWSLLSEINDHGIQFAHFDNELMVNVFTMGNTCSTSHGLSNNKSYFNEESNCTASSTPSCGFSTYFGTHLIEGEKLELKGSCFYNLKPSLVGNEADVRGMLFQRHRKECEKDYTQISWCLNCYRVSNGASFSLVKQKNFWYCFSRECSDHDP